MDQNDNEILNDCQLELALLGRDCMVPNLDTRLMEEDGALTRFQQDQHGDQESQPLSRLFEITTIE